MRQSTIRVRDAARKERHALWERIQRYPELADAVRKHVAVFGKPESVKLIEYEVANER